MAQLMQIQLQRFDAQPWGFRLQGGTDFAAPLVVQKINSGSLAEQAGLLPGDAVIKINDVDVYNLRHKDAQDLVVRSGNNFIVTVQRGGMTWRPSVTPTGQLPSPNPHSPYGQTVTKTSLAHKQQEVHHIGSGYNNSARPFNSVNGNDGQVKSIVNKQYNTPVGIYSDETIAETLSAQAEVLAGGVLGINFKKNEKQYSGDKSEVLKFLQEEETGEHEPVQHHNPPQIINNHIPSQNQNQSNVTRHVKAPVDRPKPPSTGGLPTGQNICTECERLIVGVFVRIKDKNLHVECFKCATCGTSLKNQGYYNFNNKLYCDIHARLAASQNPPSGTEGYVPVPIKPNTKLSASTISAALNNIGYNGSPTNGTSTPLYSAPPSNIESTNISDLPLPPPPSPTQLQQFQIQDAFCNGNNQNTTLNNHSRTNSSLSTVSSSSLSLSPYSSTNGINNNSSCSPINNNNAIIENSLNNHIGNPANNNNNNNYNSTSTLSLDRFASSSSSSPGHSRQQSTSSSTGSGIITATDFQLPPPPPPPLPSSQQQQKHQYNQIQQQLQQQQQLNPNPMTINQSGKQNENDMNSNNRYASSGNSNPGSSIQTNGVGVNIGGGQGQGSAPSGGRADDSINSRTGQDGDQFQYVTCQGNVIRSVIPPGKGVSVNYKVNQGFARPYGAPAPAPAAAPKSPTSYPPPQVANQAGSNNNNNWNQPRQIPVQHQQHQQQPASNMYATLPRSNAGPQEYEQHQYYECEGHRRVEEHRAASYFEEDTEIIEANRESRNSFAWPPPRDDSRPTPTAAPLYIAPPETQHVVPKPIQQKQVCQHEEQTQERLQQEHEEQQQMQWQSRSAPQLTGLRGGMNAPEIESSSDSYTSTCTTTTTTSEEYQRMYNAQVQAYQMQGYDQSGSELDYHMDMEVAAMQQQNEQCYLSSSECLSGRRSAQECVESLAGTLSTFRLVDMVREVTPSPIPPPKAPRHVEFNDEPQMEPDRKTKEPPKKEVPPKKEEEPQKPPKIVEPLTQQKSVEEPLCVKETYKVCGEETKSEEEKLVVEDRSEILQSQRIFQPTPEIKIEIPPVKPIPPTNIPNPCPKEWISPMVRALTTAPDTPVHMVECLCPKPCDFTCQCNPETIEKEKQEDCQRKKEAERLAAAQAQAKPEPQPIPEPEPVFLRESPPKGSNITNAMTTAPDFKLQFAPNPNNEIPLPEESEPYLPPPIDMTPYEREDRRPKSPFLKALTTAPDTPYNPFGHDVCSQLLDLPTPTEKLSMVDALITAPDRPYTPLNPEKATLIIEEQKKAEEKKPYQFQVLSNDDTCEFSATKTEQRQTSAFANMTNVASSFQPSRDPLPPGAHRSSIVPPQQQSEYESQRRASQRNVSQMSSSTCCATSSSKSVQQQYQQQQQTKSTSLLSTSTSSAISKADLNVIAHEIDEMFEDTRVPFPPPSPLSHLKARASPSGLHKPDTIPQYQRNWTVLPTQRPCRTPEPHELRENVPLAFVETPASPTPQPAVPPTHARLSPSGLHHPDSIPTYQSHRKILPEPAVLRENVPLAFVHSRSPTPNPEAVSSSTCCKGTCLNAQQQQKQQHQVHQQQQQSTIQQSSIKSSHTAASSSSTASRTMTRVSEQKQQQQQHQQYLTPTPTVPIIVEDRSGPVTMAFQSLDEHQPHDESYPPSRPYTPSLINKPAPIIPFYQTPEKLCFEECPATTGHVFDRRSVSPCPDRAKSPAPGPPPNPLSAIRAPRLRDSDLPTASPRTLQVGSITTGQSYLGAQQMQQQQQQQGQILSHYQTASQSGSHSYVEKPEVVQQRQVGDLTIQKREKESRLAEEKKSQLESKTTSQVGNTQIERRRKVVEEYEHTQKAKTIEIRTGSSSSTTTSTTGGAITGADVRSSYGKTGFVANQARRLSGLEQEITNLTSQSQAISARAATLTETTFPQLSSPEPVSKFPIKTVLSPHYEPEPQKYVVSSSSSNKLVGPPPGFKQQQLSSSTQSSVSQKQQQQQTHSAQSSSSLAAVSSSCTLTNASATNQQQQSRPSAIPVPAYKPPPAPTHHAHHPQPSAGGGAAAGRCPVTGKVCSGAGSGAGSNVCRAPCSQSMQSQSSSNNNTYKPTASTGPAGFKPPQASQAPPPQQMQSQQQPKQPLFKPNIPAVNVSNSPTSSFAPPPPTPSTQPAPGSGPSSNIGGKGKAFGATSAPKRGRGILNKAVESGVRVPLCSSCNMQIRGPFITALGRIWCPDHFMCVNANCRRPLQDVGFVEEKGDLYCEYCFEKYLAPTCSKCSGKIKGDCLNAIGRHFHPECFTCAHCGKLFGNTPFFLEEGMAYCEADWNELFTTKCFACGFPVEAGDRWVEALGNNYHSQCFNCTYCKKNLEGQSFYNKGGRPFCKNHAR